MHLDLKHLRTLSELRDAGNLNAAAQRLHVTPSALSHQLATLEQALGVQLFQRKSRPLSFTAAGLRLLEAAADILPRMREKYRSDERWMNEEGEAIGPAKAQQGNREQGTGNRGSHA